jgi:Uma2 family endonuclease
MVSRESFESECLSGKISHPCELVDGVVVERQYNSILHGITAGMICGVLGEFVASKEAGTCLIGVGLFVSSELPRVRGMDFAYLSHRRLPRSARPSGFLRTPPNLVIEVFDRQDRWDEMYEKIADYHNTGVDLVWVADPHTRTVKVFPLNAEPFLVHDGQDIDGGIALPGFKAPIAQFFDPE